ncbi:YkgJ family cysteine cluster protein [Budviciaceae bacterium CWB-B4]|uniref:YkgJ family cysteine cluster protein n=1 Tax=Limnobaculum xujianqingii TaxID=2738837 RepID=A0A9D7FUK5_9GAMM|nr:YkgJ family cysteine cluster protein [Limnobaculum xujianqingii]MBK5073893.1 YkgJ family cysteine cluster protein [Limnobaculum xujianqingii]MBK5177213.1 YkgJ family cysteine cluster protein [Limnobaculum xujianqingii]
MECRKGCGACCIGLSISSPIPGMPDGKPADVPCIHLDESFLCKIFHHPERPKVCAQLKPREDMCFSNRNEALRYLQQLEILTSP